MAEIETSSPRSLRGIHGDYEDRDRRLVDQFITVRVLTHVVSALVLVAAGAWWFLFDEIKSVGREITAQRTELLQEVARIGSFEARQRKDLGDRVNDLQGDIQSLQSEVGELRAGVQHIGQTADAIFSVVVSGYFERSDEEE